MKLIARLHGSLSFRHLCIHVGPAQWSPQSKLRKIPGTCFGIVCTNDAIIEDNHSSTHRSIPFQTRSHRVCLISRVSNIISCSQRQRQDCSSTLTQSTMSKLCLSKHFTSQRFHAHSLRILVVPFQAHRIHVPGECR